MAEINGSVPNSLHPCPMTPQEKAQLYTKLAVLLESGLTVYQSLIVIAKKSNPRLGRYLGKVIKSLGRGEDLSVAFRRAPRIFDWWTASLLDIAATSGALPEMLLQLAAIEKQQTHRQNFYRSVTIAAATTAFSLLLLLATILYTHEANLNDWLLWMFIAGVVGFMVYKLIPRLPLIRRIQTARSMLYLAELELPIRCGLPILMAIELVRDRIPCPQMRGTLTVALGQIPAGKNLSQCLRERLPAIAINLIRTGEETGHLDGALYNVQQYYEQELMRSLRLLQRILIPMTLLSAGGVVAILSLEAMKSLFILLPS